MQAYQHEHQQLHEGRIVCAADLGQGRAPIAPIPQTLPSKPYICSHLVHVLHRHVQVKAGGDQQASAVKALS